MSLFSCVSNWHKFPAEFRWLSAPPVRICINFLSNFFVAAPVEKVEFLWQDWLPIIRRRINFPIGAHNPQPPPPPLRCSSLFLPLLQLLVHCVNAGAVVRFLRQKALVAPPLFPSKPHSTAGSRTIKITNSGQNLGLGHLYNSIIQVSNVRLSEDYFG